MIAAAIGFVVLCALVLVAAVQRYRRDQRSERERFEARLRHAACPWCETPRECARRRGAGGPPCGLTDA